MTNYSEMPPTERSQIQGPDPGRRNFLKATAVAGAVAATAGLGLGFKAYESFSEDPTKESLKTRASKLMEEMQRGNLASVPMIVTNENNSILSEAGWTRLEMILKERNIKPTNQDEKITFAHLKKILDSAK